MLKLFPPTSLFGISQAMQARQLSLAESKDKTVQQRVHCEAGRKDLCDAAHRIVIAAARKHYVQLETVHSLHPLPLPKHLIL